MELPPDNIFILTEDEDLPQKQRNVRPKLPPTGRISSIKKKIIANSFSCLKRKVTKQEMELKAKEEAEAAAAAAAANSTQTAETAQVMKPVDSLEMSETLNTSDIADMLREIESANAPVSREEQLPEKQFNTERRK